MQLKLLQTLPSLLQNYGNVIRGELLGSILEICSNLHGIKNPIVSSTATATLQQLVLSVYESVTEEDGEALIHIYG